MLYFIYLSLGAFLFSLLGTRLVILSLRGHPMFVDQPNARSNHAVPTPRGGGIAVVLTLAIFLLAADASYWLIIGITLLASISLVDDILKLSPLPRLCAHVFTVLIVLEDTPFQFFGGYIPFWVDRILVVGAWVWFINLFNFMDGIDGISATEMIGIGLGLGLVLAFGNDFGNQLSLFALVVIGTGMGFLWWNRQPAKIFLGDVGSVPVGFLLGYMLLYCIHLGYVYPALILPAYYLADSTVTLIKRIWRSERFWQAHSEHFYQRAVRAGRSHRLVVRLIAGFNMLLILLATFSVIYEAMAPFFLFLTYGMTIVFMFAFARPLHRSV